MVNKREEEQSSKDELKSSNISSLALSFIVGLAAGLFICFLLSRDQNDKIDIDHKLISNETAISMIDNFGAANNPDTTVSGHLELDVLLTYIDKMSTQCEVIGKEMSGLEYYFARYLVGDVQAGQRTILLYPTYKDSIDPNTVNHVPFDPFSEMDIVNMNNGARTVSSDEVKCVLDKSNMSPPRQNTF